MSEFINNVTRRKEILKSVLRQLHEGKTVEQVKAEFGELAKEAGSAEIAEIEQMLIEEGLPAEEIQSLCDVHVAVFRDGLDAAATPESTPGHPVYTFLAENTMAERFLNGLQMMLDQYLQSPSIETLSPVRIQLEKTLKYELHYARKENLLFPYLEKYGFTGPSKVMWGIHDQIRAQLKQLAALLALEPGQKLDGIQAVFAPVNQAIREMFYKEEKILYPAAMTHLKNEDWAAIRKQEPEIGYFIVKPGNKWTGEEVPVIDLTAPAAAPAPISLVSALLPLDTGALTLEQINLLLTNLPVDVTFVDENDEVRFFSQTRERIFERLPAIIGRKVQNCHPPQSVATVQKILDDFRSKTRDLAEFWIQMGGKFIHIRYYALRDAAGNYRGTIEVSQDLTHLRQLEGERRLLDDGKPNLN
ncbi:DUF438 domain-containing protein [bacterium]|nr:DUF438 domain-containing protein [bacterium]